MPQTAPLRSNDPERLGTYRLTGRLGEGGQGVVYLGEDPEGTHVAVKLLHAQFTGDAKMRARFAGEFAAAKRVAPFCTARILDADVEGDVPYLVSEFIDGPSLRGVIDAEGPRSGNELQRLAIGTATALAAIHEAGIVHRDFKPTNVLLAADGPRVIDFGIARALDATGTISSTAVGTPSYMAPEQIAGETTGPPTDVFAWACTIVLAATGSPPFGQDSIPAVMNRIVNHQPGLGLLMGPLRDTVAACLAKNPAQRPTAQQVLLRLLSDDGVVLPGAGATPASEVLTQGAQAAAESTPPGLWTSPGARGEDPGPGRSGDPPRLFGPGSHTPSPGGHTPVPGGPGGNTPPPGGDTPPPGMYGYPPGGHTPPPGSYGPGGNTPPPGGPFYPPAPYPGRRRARPGVIAGAAAALVLLVSAGAYAAVKFAGHGGTNPAGKDGGTLRMAMYEPDNIDPSNALLTPDSFAVENLFTGLSTIGADGRIRQALATQVSSDSGCTHWVFTVKQGTKFSDGEPVDAAAFARSWNRTARNKGGGEGYLMNDIVGYDDVIAGKTSTMRGVTADGPGTLRVDLTHADCDFEQRVAAPVFAPVPPSAGEPTNATYNRTPIGNGPFKVAQYVQGGRLRLVRNDAYAFAKPRLDSVDVTFVTDVDRALSDFDAGRYDWVELQPSSVPLARARHVGDGKLIKGDIGGMTYLLPVGDKGAMRSKEARLAASYALDRQAIVSTVYQGMYSPARSVVPPAIPGAETSACTACVSDPAKAKTFAAQAGLKPGSKVTLSVGDTTSYTQLAALVQTQLKNVLGWDVRLRKLPLADFYKDEAGKDAQGLYPLSWVADYPSAENFLDTLLSSDSVQTRSDGSVGGNNFARYRSSAFDTAMNAARSTSDLGQRTQRLREAEKVALDDMALIPLYSHTVYRVADTKAFTHMKLDYIGYPVLTQTARR